MAGAALAVLERVEKDEAWSAAGLAARSAPKLRRRRVLHDTGRAGVCEDRPPGVRIRAAARMDGYFLDQQADHLLRRNPPVGVLHLASAVLFSDSVVVSTGNNAEVHRWD